MVWILNVSTFNFLPASLRCRAGLLAGLLLVALPAAAIDSDQDGLEDSLEVSLGLDPGNADSDCDALDDGTEVGTPGSPIDTDGDGVIDALESAVRDSNLDGVRDEIDPDASTVWRVGCARFIPSVLTTDAAEAASVEVTLATGGVGVTSVALGNSFAVVGVTVDGAVFPQTGSFITLFDNGSNGDRVAGDGIWTRDNIRIDAIPLPPVSVYDFDQIRVVDSSGTQTLSLWSIGGGGASGAARLGRLDVALQVTATEQSDGFWRSPHVINLVDPLAMIEVQRYLMLRPPTSTIQMTTARFYAVFGDAFDFLLVQPIEPTVRGFAGTHTGVKNQVSGIGKTVFDTSAAWGSSGRLQSLLTFNATAAGPYIHELTHRWSQSLSTSLGFGQCAGGHWGLVGVGVGPVGGFNPANLVDNGDGSWSMPISDFSLGGPGTDRFAMNEMDLYLAGLIPPSQVTPFPVPENPSCSISFSGGQVTFTADALLTRTIGEVTAAHGARIPSVTSSQKDFTAAWIVFSAQVLTDTEMGFFEYQADYLGLVDGPNSFRLSFEEATGGRATLDTSAPVTDIIFKDGMEG